MLKDTRHPNRVISRHYDLIVACNQIFTEDLINERNYLQRALCLTIICRAYKHKRGRVKKINEHCYSNLFALRRH